MLKLWIHCLLKASHKERNQLIGNQVVNLEIGQFITGRKALANEFNKGAKDTHIISESTLWRWLQLFEQLQMLNIKKTTKYSVVTVVNWCEYQWIEQQMDSKWTAVEQQVDSSRTTSEQQMDNKRTSDEQQMNTNNNVNNLNNVNNDNNSNNDNNVNHENNAINEKKRPTDKDLKDSFNAPSITNSVDREKEEKKKEKTVVCLSVPSPVDLIGLEKQSASTLTRSEQIASIEKAIRFTFDNVDEQVYKEIQGWLMMHNYELVSEAIKVTAQLDEPPPKLSSHILTMLADWKNQGINTYEHLLAKQEQTA